MRTPFVDRYGRINLTIYTKPSNCGGNCIYCFSEDDYPNSFINNEDTLRSKSVNWSSYHQLKALFKLYNLKNGIGNKYEIIILGGSFTYHDEEYLKSFIKGVYDYLNGFIAETFEQSKFAQKDGQDRCVVLSIETRPDLINSNLCKVLLRFGVTKIELGIQSLDQRILDINRRNMSIDKIRKATKLSKDFGFKIGYHMMAGMVGSSLIKDIEILGESLWEDDFNPDYLKLYPCILLDGKYKQPDLEKHLNKSWIPLNGETYSYILKNIKPKFPGYVYINRLQRIIPSSLVKAGPHKLINRDQYCGLCKCIWHRSYKGVHIIDPSKNIIYSIMVSKQGVYDYFIEAVTEKAALLGFARLRTLGSKAVSILREIRIFGPTITLSENYQHEISVQHRGIGKEILTVAEKITRKLGLNEIYVNSGIGAHRYFEKLGYIEKGYYLSKALVEHTNN